MGSAKSLDDFPNKGRIFIDANIFLHHAFDLNESSVRFLQRVERGTIKAYTSLLVLEEVFFKLLIQQASNFLPRVTLQDVKSLLKGEEKKEEIFLPLFRYQHYIETLKAGGLKIGGLTEEDIPRALHISRQWGLLTADALHLAVMERKRIVHLASADRDFEEIEGITLWRQ